MPIIPFIAQFLRPFRCHIVGIIIIMSLMAVHLSLKAYIIKLIIDSIRMDRSLDNVIMPVICYIIMTFSFVILKRLHNVIEINFFPKLKTNITLHATQNLIGASYGFFQNHFAGSLSEKVNSLSKGCNEIVALIINDVYSNVLALIIATYALMCVHYKLGIILLIWSLFLIITSIVKSKNARILSKQAAELSSQVSGTLVDCFTNILSVRLFVASGHERQMLSTSLENSVEGEKRLGVFLLKMLGLQGLATATMLSACLLVLITAVSSHRITAGDFALVFTLCFSMSDIIVDLSKGIVRFTESYGKVTKGLELLKQSKEMNLNMSPENTLRISRGEIQMLNVNFAYPGTKPLFTNHSLTIKPYEKIGLVGYSGSGKTTLVNLLLRLFEINSGQILVDQQDLRFATKESIHSSIAMIPQDLSLFHRSIIENIRYGRLHSTDEEVIMASKLAHAHEFITELPKGYETIVGERGIKLSSGQRQRIAIARAFLKNAPIILIDEATSALDSITENLIKQSLTELTSKKTTLIIAHRLSTLINMDRIIIMSNGQIVQDGHHNVLIKTEGLYKALWDAQIVGN